MSLKDWKKIAKNKWQNRKNEMLWVEISTNIHNKPIVQVYKWILYMSEINEILRKSFKTKSQALKFAKSYMRGH